MNTFGYVGQDPISRTDANGLCFTKDPWALFRLKTALGVAAPIVGFFFAGDGGGGWESVVTNTLSGIGTLGSSYAVATLAAGPLGAVASVVVVTAVAGGWEIGTAINNIPIGNQTVRDLVTEGMVKTCGAKCGAAR